MSLGDRDGHTGGVRETKEYLGRRTCRIRSYDHRVWVNLIHAAILWIINAAKNNSRIRIYINPIQDVYIQIEFGIGSFI